MGWQGNKKGEFEQLCKREVIQIYSKMSETKAAYAERTTRSLKNILSRYMNDNGYKYNHKLTQFVTTLNSRRNCSIDLIPKNVQNSEFLSLMYSKPLREVRKSSFKIGDRVRISKFNLSFKKRVISHSLHKRFSKLLQFFQKPSKIHNKGWTRWDYPR